MKKPIFLKLSLLIISGFFIVFPIIVSAEANWIMPDPKIKIPYMENISSMAPICTPPDANGKQTCSMPWLSEYIAGIYKYSIGIVAILATIVLMISGVTWMTAAGNQTRVGEAKQWITGAITGLVLVFSSYTILYFVNPDLVALKPISLKRIAKVEPPKPSSDRYTDCGWEVLPSCPNGKSLSDGYCDASTKPKADGYSISSICCCTITPLLGCVWSDAGCGLLGFIESNEEDCGSGSGQNCCCPSAKEICENLGLDYTDECADCIDCAALSVPTKDGDKANMVLVSKLASAYSATSIDWRVTEAWPPVVAHASACHTNGGCVDVNLMNNSTAVDDVKKVYDNLTAAGLNPTYEHKTDCPTYTAAGISCYANNVTPHFHVK